jgi:hypothetical protein
MPENSDKVRAAPIDFVQADVECLSVFGVGLRHTPAQIDIDQPHVSGPASLFQFGKHHASQMIALPVHVPKSGRQEDPYRFPGWCHGTTSEQGENHSRSDLSAIPLRAWGYRGRGAGRQ